MTRSASLLVLLVAAAPLARAATPLVMSHSGHLLDSGDRPVTREAVTLGFSVWTDATSSGESSKVWPASGESACIVDIRTGYYGVTLDGTKATGCGAGLLADLFAGNEPRYLQVSVDGVSMLPRSRVGSAPNAAMANRTLDADRLGGQLPAYYAVAGHTHSASEVTDFDAKAAAAVSTAGVAWDRVLEKPATFPATAHTHPFAELNDVGAGTAWPGTAAWARVTDKPATFPATAHTHALAELNDVGASTAWPGTAAWARVTDKPATFPPSTHAHTADQVSGIPASLAGATVPGAITVTGKVGIGGAATVEALEVTGRALANPVASRWFVSANTTALASPGNALLPWSESFNNATDYFARTADNKGIVIKKAGTYLLAGSFYYINGSKGDELEGYVRVNGVTRAFLSPTSSTDDGVCTGAFTDIVVADANDTISYLINYGQGDVAGGASNSYLVITRLN